VVGKKIDLTGQRFGRWTVIKKSEPDKWRHSSWFCKCDCGNEKIVSQYNLKRKTSESCGCLMRERTSKANKLDVTNKRFGKLIAIRDSGIKQDRTTKWICKCDCGNETIVSVSHLNSGHTVSCGCFMKEESAKRIYCNYKQMLEKKYGKSLVEGTSLPSLTSKIPSNNKSGVKGVYFNKQKNAWSSAIKFKGERKYLGTFQNKQDAINARKEAEDKYFKPILEKYSNQGVE